MTDPIDYSRPVGWWCPVCGMEWPHYPHTLTHVHQHAAIPRYLPIPEGQRPPSASEVEEAEVVTWASANPCAGFRIGSVDVMFTEHGYAVGHWFDEPEYLTHTEFIANELAQASARARIVTGATE